MGNAYKIEPGLPDAETYVALRKAGGLTPFSLEAAVLGLKGTIFGIIVKFDRDIIGMGRLIGDGGCMFQITDIVVEPVHQGKGLGHQIMSALSAYIRENLPEDAYISLIADKPADRLYSQYGFEATAPASIGMARLAGDF